MRSSHSARLWLGASALILAFVALSEGHPVRNVVTQAVLGTFDAQDHRCRSSFTAVGAACPAGCIARPLSSAESRTVPTECHSALWMATCGKACEPQAGFEREEDGKLVDGRNLIVVLHGEPDTSLREALDRIGVMLSPRFDGLDRYDAVVTSGSVTEAKKRLTALPQVEATEFVAR